MLKTFFLKLCVYLQYLLIGKKKSAFPFSTLHHKPW